MIRFHCPAKKNGYWFELVIKSLKTLKKHWEEKQAVTNPNVREREEQDGKRLDHHSYGFFYPNRYILVALTL